MGGTAVAKSRSYSPQHIAHVEIRELDAARALLEAFPPNPHASELKQAFEAKSDSIASDSEKQKHGFFLEKLYAEQDDPSSSNLQPIQRRPRSGSEGLDYLAALASKERRAYADYAPAVSSNTASSDDGDSVSMPPPPPRRRVRSVSNPEGMEKYNPFVGQHRYFVLPASILEEELAEAEVAIAHHNRKSHAPPTIYEHDEEEDDQDEDCLLTQDELICRARSRLLEDISENSVANEKGKLVFPQFLDKYNEIYSKNGRIGIYTPQERAAVIDRYLRKRKRRIWNKKIRYNCRKNLADSRLRIKGRFVKRKESVDLHQEEKKEDSEIDDHMPDVNDPEAGFAPTEDMPYRRLRRHTVT